MNGTLSQKVRSERLRRHLLKLLAVLFSFSLWFCVLNSDPLEVEVKLPLILIPAKGKAISEVPTGELLVKVKGPRVFVRNIFQKGEKVFIILDEILKGTNSKDKEIGSALFLQKLKRLKTKGIIATHDLSLCVLEDSDKAFKNMYFDSIIEGNKLSFDYKINNGVCQNMNASFLLKQMKLVD